MITFYMHILITDIPRCVQCERGTELVNNVCVSCEDGEYEVSGQCTGTCRELGRI